MRWHSAADRRREQAARDRDAEHDARPNIVPTSGPVQTPLERAREATQAGILNADLRKQRHAPVPPLPWSRKPWEPAP